MDTRAIQNGLNKDKAEADSRNRQQAASKARETMDVNNARANVIAEEEARMAAARARQIVEIHEQLKEAEKNQQEIAELTEQQGKQINTAHEKITQAADKSTSTAKKMDDVQQAQIRRRRRNIIIAAALITVAVVIVCGFPLGGALGFGGVMAVVVGAAILLAVVAAIAAAIFGIAKLVQKLRHKNHDEPGPSPSPAPSFTLIPPLAEKKADVIVKNDASLSLTAVNGAEETSTLKQTLAP